MLHGAETTETGNERLISCIKLPKILIYAGNYAVISGFGRFRFGFGLFGFRSLQRPLVASHHVEHVTAVDVYLFLSRFCTH